MGKVINLNRFRKNKAKAQKQRQAETNRRLHGRTKEERRREDAEKQRLERAVELAHLDAIPEQEKAGSDNKILDNSPATLDALESLADSASSLSELSESLRQQQNDSAQEEGE